MTKVTLHKVSRPRPRGRPRHVWMLRWYGTDGKRYGETLGEVGKVTKREVSAVRREKQSKFDCKLERPDKPKQMTLSEFHPYYLDRRQRGDAGRGHLRGFPKLAP